MYSQDSDGGLSTNRLVFAKDRGVFHVPNTQYHSPTRSIRFFSSSTLIISTASSEQ